MARILWLSVEMPDRAGQGGQRRQFHQIRELARRGHHIEVVVPASLQDDTSLRPIAQVSRPRLHLRGRRIPFRLGRIHALAADPRWDVIVVSHHGSAWLIPDSVPAPVLVDVHNVTSFWHRKHGRPEAAEAEARSLECAASRATALMTCSDRETGRLVEVHPSTAGRVMTAPLGVDPAEWPDQVYTRHVPRIALFGSWEWLPNALGLDWFLRDVVPILRRWHPDAVVEIAGTGHSAIHGLPDGVSFVGRVDDLSTFTADATVVAVPVLDGVGASLKFVEALATGASVIATPDAAHAFDDSGAFVSADPGEWVDWIGRRLELRLKEASPSALRANALERFTWSSAVTPIDLWIDRMVDRRRAGPTA